MAQMGAGLAMRATGTTPLPASGRAVVAAPRARRAAAPGGRQPTALAAKRSASDGAFALRCGRCTR
jgi:hypothetical protein